MSIRNCAGLFSWARGVVAALFRVHMHARAHHHFALGTPGACLLPPQLSWTLRERSPCTISTNTVCIWRRQSTEHSASRNCFSCLSVNLSAACVSFTFLISSMHVHYSALALTWTRRNDSAPGPASEATVTRGHGALVGWASITITRIRVLQPRLTWSPRISGRAPSSAPPRWP
jgi:hypothetical protein